MKWLSCTYQILKMVLCIFLPMYERVIMFDNLLFVSSSKDMFARMEILGQVRQPS